MGEVLRLDKFLTDMGIGTRSQVKNDIKKGKILVEGEIKPRPEMKVAIDTAKVFYEGRQIFYCSKEYIMLNKPAGVISATEDKQDRTVLDLIKDAKRQDLFPVGRLDKDTEGLLLITNDGELAHALLSPNKHVSKVYYAKIEGMAGDEDKKAFEEGVFIEEGIKTKPALLKIIKSGETSEILLTIYEGKFHQVKRMFEAVGKKVKYLKRISMGSLLLDESLSPGEYRRLTDQEIKALKDRS